MTGGAFFEDPPKPKIFPPETPADMLGARLVGRLAGRLGARLGGALGRAQSLSLGEGGTGEDVLDGGRDELSYAIEPERFFRELGGC